MECMRLSFENRILKNKDLKINVFEREKAPPSSVTCLESPGY